MHGVRMIKEIDKSDIEECVDVIKKSFLTVAYEFGFTIENAPRFTAYSVTEERLLFQLTQEHRLMYAYYDSGKIIGYYSLLQNNKGCELNNLCVLPQYRHKYIGAELLKSAFKNAKEAGAEKINIGIVEENKILREWYENYGFIHIGIKKFDFFPFTCGYMKKEL